MRGRGLGWGLQEKNHQGLLIEGHRNKNRSWASSPRPPSFPPFLLLLCLKQNKTITLCVCTCTCMFWCIYVGYQRIACRSGFSPIMCILEIQLQAWGRYLCSLSHLANSLPSSILSGKILSDQKGAFWEVFFYTRNKQTPTLATMFQVVCRSLYSNFSLFPYEMGR